MTRKRKMGLAAVAVAAVMALGACDQNKFGSCAPGVGSLSQTTAHIPKPGC